VNRRRFLQLTAAGVASLPTLSLAKDNVVHSKGKITKTPYPGHVDGVAKLPAWDGATSSESVAGSMRMFRGNMAGTYYGSGKLSEKLRLVWKFRMSDFATHLKDKPVTWGGTGWTGQTLKYGDYVYSGSVGGHFHCWEAKTGKLVWVFAAQRMFKGSPCLYKNRIYVPNVDNHIRCLDATNGKMIWDWAGWADCDSSPRILDGKLYIGGEDGDLKCFDAETGKLEWKHGFGRGEGEEPGSEGIECSLAIADNVAYFGHLDGHVRAFSLKEKKLLWKSPNLGLDIDASALIIGDKLYVGIEEGKAGTFFCIDRANGKKVWSKTVGGGVWSSAAKFENNVIVGGNGGKLYCFDAATGNEVWTYKAGHGIWSSPQVVDGKVMFGSYGKNYEMLEAATGKSIWKFDMTNRSHSGAAIEDGHIWVGSGSGHMYCFGP
jgi:outer membrane protein assembly factor BamB